MAKDYIEALAKSIVPALQMAQARQFYGNPSYNVVYGYYRLDGRFCSKIKMRLKNG